MEVNELRIGDYVKHPRNDFAMVESIQGSAQGLYALTFKDETAGYWIEHDGESICEGIPLNEEWLIKFGFIKRYERNEVGLHYSLNEDRVYLIDDIFEYERTFVIGGGRYNLFQEYRFVHQLQNLYFVLTGEELKLSKK